MFKKYYQKPDSLFSGSCTSTWKGRMGWPTTTLSFPSMSRTQTSWKRSFCLPENHNNSTNRFQFWSPGRTVRWLTTWYLMALPGDFESPQQMLSRITLALRILEYTLEIQPETEVCQIRNFKHQMIFFSRLQSNHSSTTKVLASPHLWSRTTC